jgi:hypothetical protein
MALDRQANQLLRDAFKDGIIETVLRPFSGYRIPHEMFSWVLSEDAVKKHPQNANQFDLLQHPKSRRYQESRFEAQTHPDIAQYWAVELAQIVVPQGHVGFLMGLEQVLNDADGNYYPSNQEYWGSPQFVLSDVNNCRWYLTLDFYDGSLPVPFNFSSTSAIGPAVLPGMAYSELSEIDGLWYPAHSPASQQLKTIIPGARMLRFFFLTPPTTDFQWQVRGRLRAYTQSTFSKDSQSNARLIY